MPLPIVMTFTRLLCAWSVASKCCAHCTCFSMSLATLSDPGKIQVLEKFFIVYMCFSHRLQTVCLENNIFVILQIQVLYSTCLRSKTSIQQQVFDQHWRAAKTFCFCMILWRENELKHLQKTSRMCESTLNIWHMNM